ncbi:ATP-binding domain-containing protein [Flavobacterium sp. ZS1P14]|uniref:ATP-binding domain-containing protein n=1 Tax=Flavobacterium sp. ZS1P14 TaxID=3401729 RepID=UPI003AB0DAF6
MLEWYCKSFKTTLKDFLNFIDNSSDKIRNIRNNKKIHFYMDSGTVKLSTIHSFKGWESETVFLIIEKKFTNLEATFDEILYTGLTRSKKNLLL